MKKIFIIFLSVVLIFGGITSSVFADSAAQISNNEAKVLICSDKGIEGILGSQRKNISSVENESAEKSDTNISFTKGIEKDGTAGISMDGYFYSNSILCAVNAEGEVESYQVKQLDQLELGHLKGTITIGEQERKINVHYESSNGNLYYSITINSIEDEEGFAVISFGSSLVDKDVLEELKIIKDQNESFEIPVKPIEVRGYDPVDSGWEELDTYGGLIGKGVLFLEDDIIDDGDDGKMLVTIQVDKDEAEDVIENEGYNVLALKVDEFKVDIVSLDEESSFGSHHPDEDNTDDQVFDFILSAFSSLPNIPQH